MGRRLRPAGSAIERALRGRGYHLPAGVDEAGRGCLAGPVVAAAVILSSERPVRGLRDSKLLRPGERERLVEQLLHRAVAVGVSVVDRRRVDSLNVHRAALHAMRKAVEGLEPRPDYVLVDGFAIPDLGLPQRALIGGDRRCASIAAASNVAKVVRDRIMVAYDRLYPEFGFRRNKGYATAEHREALRRSGPCSIHRTSFRPVRERQLPFEEVEGAAP